MKFSKGTMTVLNSLSSINPSILFPAGSNILLVMDASKSFFAKAVIPEVIDEGMAIYDVPQFVSTLNLFGEYDFEPKSEYGIITYPNDSRMRYVFAHPSVVAAPTKDINFPEHHIEFDLDKDTFESILKIASSSGMNNLVIVPHVIDDVVDRNNVVLKVTNVEMGSTNESNNEWTKVVPATIADSIDQFFIMFYVANLNKMVKRDFNVKLSSKKISMWTAINPATDVDKSYEVQYAIALAIESVIEDTGE